MTAIDMGRTRQLDCNKSQTKGHWIVLLLLGFAIGYLVFGTPKVWDQTPASISYDAGSIADEDWHGNVRRSYYSR